jgi:hypothetical protein
MSPGRRFDPLAYRDPHPWPPLIRALGPFNRHLVLPHLLRIRRVDLPEPDLERLRAAIQPGTAAFVGPNHPEFMTDWMIDKELSRRVSPLMAHWASYEVVNQGPAPQWFWLSNNLVANAPGGGGKEYSVGWALRGHGVLLHPEGVPTWHGDRVASLVPGIVDMAWSACRAVAARGREMPVLIVPVVWKLRFASDVGPALDREMDHIEAVLGLPRGRGLAVERRFAELQWNVLRARAVRFGFPVEHGPDAAFFTMQRTLAERLMALLEARYGPSDGDVWHRLHAFRRAVRERSAADPERARDDRRRILEVERLHRFVAEVYDHPTLAQEHLAENLKQLRAALLTRGWREALHNMVPVAVAPRVAHIRAPEPIAVHDRFVAGDGGDVRRELLAELRARLQSELDALNATIAPEVDRWRRPNPFWTGVGRG